MSEHRRPTPNHFKRIWLASVVPATVVGLALAGGSLVALSHSTTAPAETQTPSPDLRLVDDPLPAPGKTWIQGVVTDQANHPLDNVNVEVWPADPGATEPVASNLTYAGEPDDARHQHGVFRVEVPTNQPYVIVMSGVRRAEDGDAYRMRTLGGGRPILARAGHGTAARSDDATGRVVDLGTFQLARQGKVSATATARLAKKKVAPGHRAHLKVKVTSRYVAAPTGTLVVHVNGKKVTTRLRSTDKGKATILLPKLTQKGQHAVKVAFRGTRTIRRAVADPVQLTVR